MRLAAQAKSGFYPIAPEVVDLILPNLTTPKSSWCLLDPCMGKGEALAQFASGLGCPKVYGIELDAGRVEEARALIGAGSLLGPCDALSARITSKSFGLVYCNPPFDQVLDGGRAESRFLFRSTSALAPEGVLVFVLPESQVWCIESTLRTCYRNVKIVRFPEQHRPFKEVCIFALRRRHNVDLDDTPPVLWCKWGDVSTYSTYLIPPTEGPKTFEKTALTEPEILEHLARSPLSRLFNPPPAHRLARPPLPLGKGHTSLLLASGQLDGVVEKDGVMHVVRGSTRKEVYVKDETETVDGEGNVIRKWVEAERMVPLIRTAWRDGRIETHV